jgi:UDP-N-acetylmuramoylalanine--D-glutamate ligase
MTVLVIGAAVSGRAAARLARHLGREVVVYDRSPKAAETLSIEGFVVVTGTWDDRLLDGVDLVVTSPGVPEHAAPLVAAGAAGITVWSELEFGTRHLEAPFVAVTGTNGKTTVTAAAASMLTASGLAAVAAGNIGTPVCSIIDADLDAVVLEASSFQLRFVDGFHPTAAAIINVAPDHLDWHGTEAAYAAAKARIFENMAADDLLAYDLDDPGAVILAKQATAALVPVSGTRVPEGGAGRDGDDLVLGGRRYRLPTTDPSYATDLALAAVIALHAGATEDGIARGLAGFEFGAHRRQVIGSWDGITWINDSKATNPHAARASAAAYEPVVLIAGGRNKGLDLTGMITPTVRHLVAYGEAGPAVAGNTDTEVTLVQSFDAAVAAAAEVARPGDTVLLAPGCASFDQFSSYAERGDRFTLLARRQAKVGK